MYWQLIEAAPDNDEQILVGSWVYVAMGQYRWYSYVAPARGKLTGQNFSFRPTTHWTPIIPPAALPDEEVRKEPQ
jgi:hypothetical protein